MKENLDIEKLFKDKFENFEADVNPNLWNNIVYGRVVTNCQAEQLKYVYKLCNISYVIYLCQFNLLVGLSI